jgi:predicted acetyltransferase
MDRRDGTRFYVVHESPVGELDGAAVYRIREEWHDGFSANVLRVRDVMAMNAEVYAALWHYLLNVDLVGTVRAADRPLDEPLRWLLVEPRRLRVTSLGDELWARVLDVPAALGARRYGVSDTLVLEVRDAFRPQQEGRYALDGGLEGAMCRRTDAPADLVLDVADLGATYLGGVSFSALARAGRVEEATSGAIRRADALFAAEQAPYCGTHF